MADLVKEFNDYRSKMNEKLLADDNKVHQTHFQLERNAYMEGALDVKQRTAELGNFNRFTLRRLHQIPFRNIF